MKTHFVLFFQMCAFVFLNNTAVAQNPLSDSLILFYPFSGDANDLSGNGNDGIVYGATLIADRFGNADAAYSFDGIDDYMEVTDNTKLKPITFPVSVCAWVKANTANQVTGLIFENESVTDLYTGIFFEDQLQYGGVMAISYGDGGTTGPCCRRSKIGTITTNDDQWHFVAGIIRGPTDMDLYVDCAYDPGFYSGTGDSMVYLGGNGSISKRDVVQGTFYYGGAMDDVRFYHRELTQTDLEMLYYSPQPYGVNPATVNLGDDTVLCPGSTLVLQPEVSGNVQTYLWSDGSADSLLKVESSGEYWVQVSDGCGIVSDTILVGKGFLDPVDLGSDTFMCDGQFLVLDAGNSYDTYLWSNGAFTQNIIVNSSGTYWVSVTGSGCTSIDSIQVSYTICSGNNWQEEKPIQAIYDENSNSIKLFGGNCSDCSFQFRLYSAMGNLLRDENFFLGQSQTIIHLPENLSPAFYLASFQIKDCFRNLPLVITR